MKAKDLKDIINKLDDDVNVKFYVWDYEYDDENPYDMGLAEFISLDNSNYLNLGVHK